MSGLQWLTKKYPALEFFDLAEGVGAEELMLLMGEEGEARAKTQEGKRVLKRIRQFAAYAESKLKNGRKLYKLLAHQHGFLTQIIMNNQKLKALDALERRRFDHLTELQLSNNEISELSPLATLSAPSLEELDLSSNALTIIHALNACPWRNLTTLLLSQNCIISIEGIRFGNFTALREINLSDNFLTKVRSLRKQLNGNLPNLKKLNLSVNFITDIHHLSECRFVQLELLDLRDNSFPSVFAIEKIAMAARDRKQALSEYQIRISAHWHKDKSFIYGYREKSRHKLSVKLEPARERLKRETIQKGRRLIFD